jgi:hypothetical protein
MEMPFTVEQFFRVFASYNSAIWPAQVVAYLLGGVAVALAWREKMIFGRVTTAILALFWVWIGVFYHILHFAAINQAAWIFGIVFVAEGVLLAVVGSGRSQVSFSFRSAPIPIVGACFIGYAMIVYPLLGRFFGHHWPRIPMFGVAPCPATIFTFGVLLWATKPVPLYLVIIPLLWSLIGASAAINLRVPQDYGLLVAGIVGTLLVVVQNRRLKRAA